jgi:hypothetical protein
MITLDSLASPRFEMLSKLLIARASAFETSTPLTILVNNQSCVATIATPILNGHCRSNVWISEIRGDKQ